jgi:serine/threonine protein kinase
MLQLLLAVNHLHNIGFLHRNIKPDNIFIASDGTLKLSDFFMSRLVNSTNTVLTPEDPKMRERSFRECRRLWYRAPELLFRKPVYSTEVDIWAVGCILAELALTRPIFSEDSEI